MATGSMALDTRPERSEAPEYFFKYIDLVPRGDIRATLDAQRADTLALLNGISEEGSRFRYGPDKWTIRQVLGHVNDCERLFTFRAFWLARGFDAPLPSFDQSLAAQHDNADERSWSSLVQEFGEIRASTISFFQHLPDAAWQRRGIVSSAEFTVRAFAYITGGHVVHHAAILRERYLPAIGAPPQA